jgi:predicted transcriptional regulator
MATEYVGARLDSELVKRIDAVAETLGMTRSAVLDRVLRVGLAEEEGLAKMVEGATVGQSVQRALVKALISSDFVVNLMTGLDEEVDPKRIEMMRKALARNDAKKKERGGAKPAVE